MIADELSGALVEAELTLADHRNLDYVYKKLKFQMSGNVSDETVVSIGRFVGARYVITGQLVNAGNAYRLRLAGINAETAVQESSIRLNIRDDRNFRMLLAGVQSPEAAAARDSTREEECTVYFSGSPQGTITIQRDRAGKLTVTPRLTVTGDDVEVIDREICPILPAWVGMESAESGLPKTILYTLNPKDYYPLAAIMGGFQDNYSKAENQQGIRGKIQLGSAWWFCDHRDGMEEQMRTLANLGVLPAFVGMLMDSRSFLSYPRHEYFRRILCNLIGNWVENGEYPADQDKLLEIVRNISFGNAKEYFG